MALMFLSMRETSMIATVREDMERSVEGEDGRCSRYTIAPSTLWCTPRSVLIDH